MEEYDKISVLGRGSFGLIHLCRRRVDNAVVVVKQINSPINEDDSKVVAKEVSILSSLRHRHIVRYFDTFLDAEGRLSIVMEWARGGSLEQLIQRRIDSMAQFTPNEFTNTGNGLGQFTPMTKFTDRDNSMGQCTQSVQYGGLNNNLKLSEPGNIVGQFIPDEFNTCNGMGQFTPTSFNGNCTGPFTPTNFRSTVDSTGPFTPTSFRNTGNSTGPFTPTSFSGTGNNTVPITPTPFSGTGNSSGPFTQDSVLTMLAQLADALAYLHSRRIVHRDFCARNVLLCGPSDSHLYLKLCDFGVSKLLQDSLSDGASEGLKGSLECLSPEQCLGLPYTTSCDVWALGCLLHRLIHPHHAHPFPTHNMAALTRHLTTGDHFELATAPPSQCAPGLVALMSAMLSRDPHLRPTAHDVLRSPLVTPYLYTLYTNLFSF